jgi:hypothetical protein
MRQTRQQPKEATDRQLSAEDLAKATGGGTSSVSVITGAMPTEYRSGKVTLWDHCFELPHKHLDP